MAQVVTLAKLKALKDTVLADYKDVLESEIAYPVTGMIYLSQPSSLMGESIVQVEVWVIDANGDIIYNTVYAGKKLELSFDPGYMALMMSQGKALKRKTALYN